MKMTRDTEESIRCTASTCSCVSFKPGSVQLRSCGSCGHGWVAHALEKFQLQAWPPSSCGPVEVALPGLVFDLSSLVLYGAQAVTVRLKILLDRLYSVLTPEQVEHILHTLGWSLGDYVRGYMLQFPSGKVLDRWLMVTPEEELLILKQFLRFGETRPIVELMTLHCLESTTNFSNNEPKSGQVNISTFMERDAGTAGGFKTERGYSSSGADVCRLKKNCPTDCNETVQQFDNFPGRLSLLLPFHFPTSTFHLPTKELDPPSKVTFLWKPSNSKPTERHNQEGEQEKYQIMKQPTIKIKADPDKPNLSRSVGHRKPWFQTDKDLDPQRSKSKQESTSSLSPSTNSSFISVSSPVAPCISSSPIKFTQKFQGSSSHSLSPLPSFSSSFLCSLPTSSFSSSLHPIPSTPPSLHPPPPSLCTLPSLSPAGGRKGRVCCGVCGKSFYDKGTLKIHYNAVHLKIKHRCTVAGCTMVFSSLRSRNRHSANPNPRLHTGTSRDAHTNRNIINDPRQGTHSESLIHRNTCKNVHITPTQICRTREFSNNLWKHGNDEAHTLVLIDTLQNGSNSQINPQQDNTAPQACSPPPQPLSRDSNNNFPLSDSTNRSYLHTQVLPPPPLLPVHVASSLGSHPSLIPLVSPAPGNTEHCRSLLLHHKHKSPASFPDPTSITNQPASLDDGDPEEKRSKACTSPLTNEERWWDSGDLVPKKKPRKSSMPVKIEREKMREGRNKDEEDS